MAGKVLSITERMPKEATLPSGLYVGIWGGDTIELEFEGRFFELKTDVSVSGIRYRAAVIVDEGVATYKLINKVKQGND